MSSWMNNSNSSSNENDSDWLHNLETLDEFKEEPVEIKEEPFDDMADIKQEDLVYYPSDDIKEEIEDVKEDFEEFTDVIKGEEPIIDEFNAIENESVEIKEEPIENFKEDIKDEEFSTLPIADVFCPSTGYSRPLTIDIDNGMQSKIEMGPSCSAADSIALKRPRIVQDESSMLPDCTTCKSLPPKGYVMDKHMRLMHPERYSKLLKQCAFCHEVHAMGPEMARHVQFMHPEELEKIKQRIERSPKAAIAISSTPTAPQRGRVVQDEFSKMPHCNFSAPNGIALYNHMRSMHSERLLKKCAFCDECHDMGTVMEDHVQSMHPEEIEKIRQRMLHKQCDYCDSSYSQGAEMAYHLRTKHPERRCDFCTTFHVMGYPMDQHVISIHYDELEKTKQQNVQEKCEYCDGIFSIGARMTLHVRSKHPQRKCTFCDATFRNNVQMEHHLRLNHPKEVEKSMNRMKFMKCVFCGGYYRRMATHVHWKHPEELKKISGASLASVTDNRDEQLAVAYDLPMSTAEIADLSLTDLQNLLKADSLTEPQRVLIRQIHRRGMKNVARTEKTSE